MRSLFCSFLLILCFACDKPEPFDPADYQLNQLELAISFPAVEDGEQRELSREKLDKLNVKKIRFAEEWRFREPVAGLFNWGPIEARLNWANENGYEVLLTVQSNGPDWACSDRKNERSCVYNGNQAFNTYIDSLLIRFPNQIAKIQYGNEWQSDFWYIGSAAEFVAANNIVYQAVQEHSPTTQVVLGGFTTISLRLMAGCAGKLDKFEDDEGNLYDQAFLEANCNGQELTAGLARIDSILSLAQYDELDLHLYDDPENWDEILDHFRTLSSSPLIVSEFGGPNLNLESRSESYQAERLEYYIRKLDSLQIPEAYFFRLVEGSNNPAHENSGLLTRITKREKEAFEIFRRFSNP
ncbi:MAG: hypothetical protein AAF927_18995 [Bacteroidota bacterium]